MEVDLSAEKNRLYKQNSLFDIIIPKTAIKLEYVSILDKYGGLFELVFVFVSCFKWVKEKYFHFYFCNYFFLIKKYINYNIFELILRFEIWFKTHS